MHRFRTDKAWGLDVYRKYLQLEDPDILEQSYAEYLRCCPTVPYVSEDGIRPLLVDLVGEGLAWQAANQPSSSSPATCRRSKPRASGTSGRRLVAGGECHGTRAVARTRAGAGLNIYYRIVARQQAILEAQKTWEQIVRGRDRRWETTPWGRVKWLTGPRLHTAMRTMSHYVTQLSPGGRSKRVRFLWEAQGYVLAGRGYSVIDGVRYDWEAEDVLCLVPGAAHQHVNADPDAPAEIIWGSMQPVAELMGLGGVEG